MPGMGENHDHAWNRISNILCFHYGHCRPPLTGGELEEPALVALPAVQQAHQFPETVPVFRLYPNPTRDLAMLDYVLTDDEGQAFVRVRDLMGREVLVRPMLGTTGRVELATRSFSPGLYVVEVTVNGAAVHAAKLMVQ